MSEQFGQINHAPEENMETPERYSVAELSSGERQIVFEAGITLGEIIAAFKKEAPGIPMEKFELFGTEDGEVSVIIGIKKTSA